MSRRRARYVDDLVRASVTVRRLIASALVLVLLLLAAACVSLLIQVNHTAAVAQEARAATARTGQLEARLEAEVVGECYRVDYLRWQDDVWRFQAWQRDRTAAALLRRGFSPAVHATAIAFARAAVADRFLPYTDCTAATAHPLAYSPPRAVPFDQIPPSRLLADLQRPSFFSGPAPPYLRRPSAPRSAIVRPPRAGRT